MNATIAPRLWPEPAGVRAAAPWRFAHEQRNPPLWRFELARKLPLRPRQWLVAYALVCALSLAAAAGLWWQGVSAAGLFAGAELLALGVAVALVARHGADRETIVVDGRELAVESRRGPQVRQVTFRAEWVRIEPAAAVGSLVELSGQGRSVRVGRHVRPELRAELAEELRRALRLSRSMLERH